MVDDSSLEICRENATEEKHAFKGNSAGDGIF